MEWKLMNAGIAHFEQKKKIIDEYSSDDGFICFDDLEKIIDTFWGTFYHSPKHQFTDLEILKYTYKNWGITTIEEPITKDVCLLVFEEYATIYQYIYRIKS